jgi:hypothetical protein
MAKTVPSASGIERSIPDSILREIVDIEKRTAAAYLAVVVNHFALISQIATPDRDIARYFEHRIAGSLAQAGNGLATILAAFGLKPVWFKPETDFEAELNSEGGIERRTVDWVDAIHQQF